MIKKINPSIIPYDILITGLCRAPYKGHSKGCPNYGKKQGCPPQKLINEVFDFNRDMYIIYTEFPVGKFAEKMRKKHSKWKESSYPDNPKKSSEYVEVIKNKLKEKHPSWSKEYFAENPGDKWKSSRQWYNPRRWQPKARKEHTKEIKEFKEKYPDAVVDRCPEAHGVNLTGLMYELGVKLDWQWPPVHNLENKTYMISIAGYPKSQKNKH